MICLYFNLAALVQVILVIILYVLYGVLDEYVLHWTTHTEGTKIMIVALQVAAFVCAFTDTKGLQGRLLFLPVWLVCILASLFLLQPVYFDSPYVEPTLYASSLLIVAYYFYKIPSLLKKIWAKKKAARTELQAALAAGPVSDDAFWELAHKMFYAPSLLFIYAYPVWKLIYRHAIDDREFVAYYQYLLNHMPIQTLPSNIYKRWMFTMKDALNKANSMKDYSHPALGFTRLGNTIREVE